MAAWQGERQDETEGILAELKRKAERARGRPPSRKFERVPVDPTFGPYDIPLERINVANAELMRMPIVLRYFQRLREETPVYYRADSQYGPYWSITRYEDIVEIERLTSVFSSAAENGGVMVYGSSAGNAEVLMYIAMDPPRHRTQRDSMQDRFNPTGLKDLRSEIGSRSINGFRLTSYRRRLSTGSSACRSN